MLRAVVYLIVVDGVLALYLGELLGLAGCAAVGVVLGGCWWHGGLRRRIRTRSAVSRILVPAAAVASAIDLLYLGTGLDGLVRLLLFLVLYKLLTLETARETRAVIFLACFMLVAAAGSAFGVGFLFVFVTFVLLGTWALLLQEAEAMVEAASSPTAGGAAPRARRAPPLLGLALAASAGIVVITAGLFFIIPRIGLAALPLRSAAGPLVTGFADRVELGAYGQIETDPTVVMRVQVPAGVADATALPGLRWRGIVFDTFDGQAWTTARRQRTIIRRSEGGEFRVGLPRGRGPVLRQEIFLEPIGTDLVFAAPRALTFRLRTDAVGVDDMGSVAVPAPLARLAYTVESELELPGREGWSRGPEPALDPETRERFLQLPDLAPRIPALARQVTAGSADALDTAQRLTRFLSRELRYSLNLTRRTTLDPIEEFLFVRRSGNCEYFAASLAIMLRSLGIPARVVGGFQRGEWNPYGRYFMVRLSDAHAWVEAHIGAAGWVTFDPSPRGEAGFVETGGTVRLYLDALRTSWYRYVINWTIRDQVQTAVAIGRRARAWRAVLAGTRTERPLRGLATAGVLVLIGAGAVWLWRPGGPRPRRARVRTLWFYERALRAVARRRLRPGPSETAREFCDRVSAAIPGWAEPLATLTRAYERGRFGAEPPAARDDAALAASLRALTRRPAAGAASRAAGPAGSLGG